MDPTELLAGRLRQTFTPTIIQTVLGLGANAAPAKVIAVPNARAVLAGRAGMITLVDNDTHDGAEQFLTRFAGVINDVADVFNDPAGVEFLFDLQQPDGFLGVIGASDDLGLSTRAGSVVADASVLARYVDALQTEFADISPRAGGADPSTRTADDVDALGDVVSGLGLDADIAEVVLLLTVDTLRTLAGVADGASPSVLLLIGPASQLVLVDAGVISMGDHTKLTSLGARVAASARDVIITWDALQR